MPLTFSPTSNDSISSNNTTPSTSSPSKSPSETPTKSPSQSPTVSPTASPTVSPSSPPTRSPSSSPTRSPTSSPSLSPTTSPTKTVEENTTTTKAPSLISSQPTTSPTRLPTWSATNGCVSDPPFTIYNCSNRLVHIPSYRDESCRVIATNVSLFDCSAPSGDDDFPTVFVVIASVVVALCLCGKLCGSGEDETTQQSSIPVEDEVARYNKFYGQQKAREAEAKRHQETWATVPT